MLNESSLSLTKYFVDFGFPPCLLLLLTKFRGFHAKGMSSEVRISEALCLCSFLKNRYLIEIVAGLVLSWLLMLFEMRAK
jgi:uncharacterized membrane protein